jgi:erythronate-4-phosphate dehydrogenase
MFRILCEEKIPFAREAFSDFGSVDVRPVQEIVRETLAETDILIVRSGVRVDARLLDGTPIQYVASPTAGTDHVDRAYLATRGIPFVHAPGCNADSVVEYVIAALLHLAAKYGEPLSGRTAGVVGCGNVGARLVRRLPALGVRVLPCDPPLQDAGLLADAHPLDAVLETADILTLHTPLERQGPYPTFHLLDQRAFGRMKAGAWLLNASRGAVVDGRALAEAMDAGRLGAAVLDVWEGEPEIALELLRRVDLGTPHIAGHSYEGKVNGTVTVYDAMRRHFEVPGAWEVASVFAPAAEDQLALRWPAHVDPEAGLRRLVEQMYDIAADDRSLRRIFDVPPSDHAAFFRRQRRDYPRRRTFARFTVAEAPADPVVQLAIQQGLDVRIAG